MHTHEQRQTTTCVACSIDWLYAFLTRAVQLLQMWAIVGGEHDVGVR